MDSTMQHNESSAQPDYSGETLDRLRMRRAIVAVKLELQKETLRKKYNDAIVSPMTSGIWGIFAGKESGKSPIVRYVPIMLKSMKVMLRLWALFGKRRKQ